MTSLVMLEALLHLLDKVNKNKWGWRRPDAIFHEDSTPTHAAVCSEANVDIGQVFETDSWLSLWQLKYNQNSLFLFLQVSG